MNLTLKVPSSKSLTQRALLIAGITPGASEILSPLHCDDSALLRAALAAMGVTIEEDGTTWRVTGGALAFPEGPVHCGNAGTTLRFLAALPLIGKGRLTLDGEERMRQRPVGALAEALAGLGVRIDYGARPGYPPLTLMRVAPPKGTIAVDTTTSSQFASSLMMAAPLLPGGLEVLVSRDTVSRPYLALTVSVMEAFGATVQGLDEGYRILPGGYRPARIAIEGDWSAGAFLKVGEAMTGIELTIPNLDEASIQGDRAIVDILAELSQPREHHIDLSEAPDLIAPVVVAALFASYRTVITGAAHTRVKESDRLHVLARELSRLGANIVERPDGLIVTPGPLSGPARLDPARDHRMAMAFGLVSLRVPGLEIEDPGCVTKSYPAFWEDLATLREAQG